MMTQIWQNLYEKTLQGKIQWRREGAVFVAVVDGKTLRLWNHPGRCFGTYKPGVASEITDYHTTTMNVTGAYDGTGGFIGLTPCYARRLLDRLEEESAQPQLRQEQLRQLARTLEQL